MAINKTKSRRVRGWKWTDDYLCKGCPGGALDCIHKILYLNANCKGEVRRLEDETETCTCDMALMQVNYVFMTRDSILTTFVYPIDNSQKIL